jgi:HEPN domain-containing protein
MTAQTKQWVKKAEGDFDVVLLLRRSRKPSRYDSIRFHCQQCVEKYFKAKLQDQHIRFPRTHDLVTLLQLLLPIEPSWVLMQPDLASLTEAAVEFRYPGKWATAADARRAFVTCDGIRGVVRLSLGLKAK